MPKKAMIFTLLLGAAIVVEQWGSNSHAELAASAGQSVTCRVMEVFVAEKAGATAVVFHQRDKAEGPKLGEFLAAHSSDAVEFETGDGRRHRATVFRVRSCFGRGLLLFSSKEAKVAAGDDFILRPAVKTAE